MNTWTWAWQWWGTLVAVNCINLAACLVIFMKSKRVNEIEYTDYRKWMRVLGLVFVLVASYRAVFVSSYLEQLAWFDSVANSSLLIRCMAIFAELSFAAMIMLGLLQVNKEVPAPAGRQRGAFMTFLETKTPYVLFACIALAQFFATSATITKINLLFAIEETLWAIGFVLIFPLVLIQLKRVHALKDERSRKELRLFRIFTIIMTIWCIGYGGFELFFNLPVVYWPSSIAQLRSAVPVPAIRTGIEAVRDAFLVVRETKDLAAWGGLGFVIWHSGYFSVCVWMVLFFMNGPRRLKSRQA
ncbi:MAG: hypothetical protein NTU62_11440 [Spirochaetes bacterium]|nr:hypothetical protein [Spirochaetota bacterium]